MARRVASEASSYQDRSSVPAMIAIAVSQYT